MPPAARLSLIVPVLNEAALVTGFLTHVRTSVPAAEVIVVDGGSTDGTPELAAPLADLVLASVPGRARQMNAGAARARGDVLWFLHADSHLPAGAAEAIDRALADPAAVGGCFRLRLPRPALVYRVSDSLGNLGVDVFGFALGDHGIFCRRAAFEQVRGYPEVPLLEDAEFYRALARGGRMRQLREEIVTSPRAYEAHGPGRTTAVYFAILALYVCGLPIRYLDRLYRAFRRGGRRAPTAKLAPLPGT